MYKILSREVSLCKRLLEDLHSIQKTTQNKTFLDRILVKSNKRLIILSIDKVSWIEAWGDYIKLHCDGKFYLIHQKICDMEIKLDPLRFLRVNRSAIVNIGHVKELEPMNHGDYLVTLGEGTQLNLSRNYRTRLFSLFENHLQ